MRRIGPLAMAGALLVGCGVAPTVSSDRSVSGSVDVPTVVTTAAADTAPPAAETDRVTVPLAECTPERLPTVTAGLLTFGAVGPWDTPLFDAAPPAPGGLNGAVAVEVAQALGYAPDSIRWVELTETDSGARQVEVDAAFGRWTVPDQPDPAFDHSSGYLALDPVLVTRPTDALAAATGLADLDGALIGVVGSQPVQESTPNRRWFAHSDDALAAVRSGLVRAAVVDQVSAASVTDLTAVARMPVDEGWQAPQLGARLAPGSPVTACLSAAVDLLRVNGTLDAIVTERIDLPALD